MTTTLNPTRRRAIALAFALVAIPGAAFAAGLAPFGSANFEAARKAGAPVVLHIDASWCPTCRAQKPILAKLLAEPRFKGVAAYAVDYDGEKDFMRQIGAMDRSTIVVFKGGKEIARSTGDTSEAKIAATLEQAL